MRTGLAIVVFLAAMPHAPSGAQETVSLRITTSSDVVQNAPVVFRYSLSNRSSRELVANLGYDRIGAFVFEVVGPDGVKQRVRPFIRPKDHAARLATLKLPPLAEYEQMVVLSEWLSFKQVGVYSLTVDATNVSLGAAGTQRVSIEVENARQRIQVRPRDIQYLRSRCDELAQALISTKVFDERFTALVDELAWHRDPIAVACHERVLQAEVSSVFFEALIAIGTTEARDALVRLSSHPRDWVALNAKSALAQLKIKVP